MNTLESKDKLVLEKGDSWKMFNRISKRYDLLNRILSFGLDLVWRNRLVRFVPQREDVKLLDLATGTADVALTLVQKCPGIVQAKGVDLAEKMLELGRIKINQAGLSKKIELLTGDANHIPFEAGQFDMTTMAFGIRNVEDPTVVMREMFRILNDNGRAVILEFSLPKNSLLRSLHLAYLKLGVPFIGGLISGDWKAYKYLNQTIEQFPYGESFCELLRQAGFKTVQAHPLLWGVATIYQADKVKDGHLN